MAVVKTGSKSVSWIVALLLAGWGCGFEGELPTTTSQPPPPPPPVTQAAVALSVSPSPVDAGVDAGGAPWSAEWTVAVRETAGIGGTIDFVRASLADSEGGSIAETELGAEQLSEQLGGSNRIEGGGRKEILMRLDFAFPEDVLAGDLNVTLQLSDDRGNTVSGAAEDVIQICVPRLLAPEAGATLDNGCSNRQNGILWEFDWDDCEDADFYHIQVQLSSEDGPRVDVETLTASTYTVLEERFVPEEARFGWFWRVRANVNETWGNWSPERDFVVEPVNTDCVAP